MVGEIIYILSIVFQVTGAGLVSFYWFRNKDEILKEEYFKLFISTQIEISEDEDVKVELDKVVNTLERIWTNRISFFFIALGYLVSVFGTTMENALLSCVLVLGASLFLGIGVFKIIKIISKKEAENIEYNKMILSDVPENTFAARVSKIED